MLALVSSTLRPAAAEGYDGARSRFSTAERLEQTRGTVGSLAALGFRRIVVADNSDEWDAAAETALAPAEVWRIATPEFRNKGLAELFLLRSAAARLPPGDPVLKVSGRYLLVRNPLSELGDSDVALKGADFGRRRGAMSTRAYACRDVATLQRLIARAIDEAFAYPTRIVGPRSFWRLLCATLAPQRDTYPYADPPHSIEFTLARTIKLLRLRVHFVETLGVHGTMAGTGEHIDE